LLPDSNPPALIPVGEADMCPHIIGFIEGFGGPLKPDEYQKATLVFEGSEHMLQTAGWVFNYCPRCGVKLKNPVGEE